MAHVRVRAALGLTIGVVLLAATVSQIDLQATIRVMSAASLPMVAGVRDRGPRPCNPITSLANPAAGRGQGRRAPLHLALGYLGIGYLANLVLPARTGDFLRAYLAGHAFALAYLATFGTILIEQSPTQAPSSD